MGRTNISWATDVWNPVVGCTRVSAGCDHCYAFALHNKWYAANRKASLADQQPPGGIKRARAAGLTLPFPPQYDLPFSRVQLLPDRLDQPLRWRKPRRIFVNSMSDLFHEEVPDEFLDQVFARMRAARQHVFQVLTKRPERMRAYLAASETSQRVRHMLPPKIAADLDRLAAKPTNQRLQDKHADWYVPENWRWPLPNVWLGVSVENQQTADERIPLLLETSAAVRFVSCEPLLGPVDLTEYMGWDGCRAGEVCNEHTRLDLVIVGGESGRNFRSMELDWARSIVSQCKAANVPVFFKQASGPRPGMPSGDPELDGCKEMPNRS